MAPTHLPARFVTSALSVDDSASKASSRKESSNEAMTDDDRYPGSFFRIPGVPVPGKTSWSVVK